MPINVTCPSCLTRFQVNDKFAGKSGPCPKCKSTIKIPDKTEEVVIHAPVDDAPKDSKGTSVIKPIGRKETKLSLPIIIGASLIAIICLGVAIGLGVSQTPPTAALLAVGALVLSVPLVVAGYWFLQNDELQGFQGKELWSRSAICGLIFAITWAIYIFVPSLVGLNDRVRDTNPVTMAMMIFVMIALGTAAAVLVLELEVGQGILLFMVYFVITFVLAWLAGAPLSEFIPGTPRDNRPGETRPVTPAPNKPADEVKRPPPNLLQ
jgi:hypothetical protein